MPQTATGNGTGADPWGRHEEKTSKATHPSNMIYATRNPKAALGQVVGCGVGTKWYEYPQQQTTHSHTARATR